MDILVLKVVMGIIPPIQIQQDHQDHITDQILILVLQADLLVKTQQVFTMVKPQEMYFQTDGTGG